MSQWVDRIENEYFITFNENGYQIQEWLATQDTEETGCPLIDVPFILEVSHND